MSIGMKKPIDVYYGEVPGKSLWKNERTCMEYINLLYFVSPRTGGVTV